MGNTLSTLQTNKGYDFMESEEPELDNTNMDMKDADDIDFIAGELILTTNTAHLNEVVGSDNNKTKRTIELLEKVSSALQDEAATAKYSRIIETDSDNTEKPDVDTIRQEVSKYYLDIARVLVAISLAIQPENEAETHSDDTDEVFSPNFSMARMSFCGSRINRFAKTTINGSDVNQEGTHDVAEITTIGDRYGIPELYDLYFDVDYDPETGSFLGMSEETKTIFERDLTRFYQVFSGEKSLPEHIKKFADIPININNQDNGAKDVLEPSSPLFVCKFDENNEVDCDSLFNSVHGDETNSEDTPVKSQLLTEFAEHLQKMIKSVIVKRRRLVDIVNRMFVFGTRLVDGEKMKRPRVRPYLSSDVVKSLTTETQQIITDMSVQCEIDNRIANEIFIALHAIQTLESNKRQIQTLELDLNQIVYA